MYIALSPQLLLHIIRVFKMDPVLVHQEAIFSPHTTIH